MDRARERLVRLSDAVPPPAAKVEGVPLDDDAAAIQALRQHTGKITVCAKADVEVSPAPSSVSYLFPILNLTDDT